MIYLDSLDIEKLAEEVNLLKTVEKGFKIFKDKAYQMPDRIHLDKGKDTILYMPCITEETIATKIISLFPNNKEKNLPVINGLMLLNDVESGLTKAILDGSSITAYRTGALGAIGIKHTTGKKCQNIGLIGPGVQGFHQLLFAAKVRDVKNIYVYGRNKDNLNKFIDSLKKKLPYINIKASENSTELVKNSEIIITATPSENPVVPNNKELLKGKHFIAIGSYKPKMREIPDAVYELVEEVYIDTELAIEEAGDIIQPLKNNLIKKEQIKTISQIMENKNFKIEGKTTLFKCVGMALLDLVVAEEIYKKALDLKIGNKLSK